MSSSFLSSRRRRARRTPIVRTQALPSRVPSGLSMPPIRSIPTNFLQGRYFGTVSTTFGAESVISITCQDLQRLPGVIATTSSTAASIAQSFKIKRVMAWAAPIVGSSSASSVPTTVTIAWFNGNGRSSAQAISDSSLNPACPAFVSTRPPLNSFSGLWYTDSLSDVMFDIIVTSATETCTLLVQVDIDWIASNQSTNVLSVGTSNTMSVGAAYYTPLDGVSTHLLLRQGLPSIY